MPYFMYGPTVVATDVVLAASASTLPVSEASATISGHCAAAAPRLLRTASSLSLLRPAKAIRGPGSCFAR